jgi:hypothetical protein
VFEQLEVFRVDVTDRFQAGRIEGSGRDGSADSGLVNARRVSHPQWHARLGHETVKSRGQIGQSQPHTALEAALRHYKARDVASMMLEGQNTADELVEGSRRAHTHCDGLLLGANGLALGDANGLVLGGTRVP